MTSDFDRLAGEAVVLHRAGRLAEAATAYRAALALSPGRPTILHNLGVIAAAQGDHAAAVRQFDEVLAGNPDYASAHMNRGAALEALGRLPEAIQSYGRAAALEPDSYAAHRALGFLWLAQGERGRALDHFARTYELRRGEDRSGRAQKSLSETTRAKLLHDAAQFRHIAARKRDGKRFEVLARLYADFARDFPETPTELGAEDFERIGEDYNSPIHLASAAEQEAGAVASRPDRRAILDGYREAGAVFFDGFLTPPALASLKKHLLESTIWHDFTHIDGFMASYLEDGLASPLLLQIADEFRQAFPELLRDRPLSQAWAFKGVDPQAPVGAHADDGAVSVNFWVTPDAANLAGDRGGLLICRAAPPQDWKVTGYDEDKARIAAFLEDHAADTLVVPYAENRAALFQSRLFHRSDAPVFQDVYDMHRINLTLLYGRHGG